MGVNEIDRLLPIVMAAWSDACFVATVGEDDDFFDCGGDSLAAMRVRDRLTEELGVVVTPEEMEANATPRGLAALIALKKQDGPV